MNPDTVLDIATASRPNAKKWRQDTITWREIVGWVKDPADHKECGNYLLGRLDGKLRRSTTIVSRCAITLDVDHPSGRDFPAKMSAVLGDTAALVHTTYSSSPDNLRYRVIIPTDRPMLPDEYHAVTTELMRQLGEEQFDRSCNEPARYMFKPAAQQPGWFQAIEMEGEPLGVDPLLQLWEDDLSEKPMPKPSRTKRDPFSIDGVIGAFNRTYSDIADVIAEYELPYTAVGDRWQLVGARAVAGMGEVAEGLVYSHHVTDPAAGVTCSAFDLVRLHRFGELDEDLNDQTPVNRRPSHRAMLELAADDPRVVAELVGVDFSDAMDDVATAQAWRVQLRLSSRTGEPRDIIENWDLIAANDPVFQSLCYNELGMAVETSVDLPWRERSSRNGEVFTSTDRAELYHYLEREYRIQPKRTLVDELISTVAEKRWVNPVRDYLNSLKWDGVPRVETCLPGVRPTRYTRTVARKVMTAAAARMLDPGCKWDHTLVLFGPEGIGKTFWIDRVSLGYSATLGPISSKDTLLTMQRSWILTSDEGYSLRKADSDIQKEFLTRREDVFRAPYERESVAHKRHCVIWGTTNDEVFLRRQEGNRRFLIVHAEEKVDFDMLTDEYIAQLWAEAVSMYRSGEKLYLTEEESEQAALERERFTEESALTGIIEEYLATPVPPDWEIMSPEARCLWMQNRSDGLVPEGDHYQDAVCSSQIWVEALGRKLGDHRRMDLLDITNALKEIRGWAPEPGRRRLRNYGPQLVFTRTANIPPEGLDLL